MKPFPAPLFPALVLALTATVFANPRLSSWFTDNSGQYARLYPTTGEEAAGPNAAVTTWNRGQGVQSQPSYAGIHEVSSDATSVYIRTTGLASYIMGPWYLNATKTNLFPNYPANTATVYRLDLDPGTPPANKTLTGLGAIGYFVDGVAMFDSRDAFSYDTSAGQDDSPVAGTGVNGDGIWNRDAYVNEGVTFDAGNAHQAGINYHYHANPPGLRHLLGDSVDHDPATNTYTETFNGGHSPIIGWVRDSYPIYGPYGYDDPIDPASGVRRMISGFQKRAIAVRTSLPAWAVRVQGIGPTLASGQYGPNVTAGAGSQYELGHYLEDYDYKGDLAMTPGVDFDLDEHNGRFCVTPEFPAGTYAYFTSIEADGTPAYPYNIGRTYYGNPSGAAAGTIPAGVTVHFEGGPEVVETIQTLALDEPSGDVIISWNAAQGGSYDVESSGDLDAWTPLGSTTAISDEAGIIDTGRTNASDRQFYRATRTALAPFDDRGFDYDDGGDPPGGYSPQLGDNANQWNYRKMLEALDTELGRLLASVDMSVTNIILVGDNGTANQVVQAPFGPRGAGAAAHGKGDLYEGGVHVPMVVNGPAVTVTPGTTTDKLVHVIDLFSSVLELGGINPAAVAPADAVAQSHSIVPILAGTDTAGRTIILDDYPDYKWIVNGSPTDPTDTPTFEFYDISADPNEQSPLNIGSLSGVALDAYNACMAKDAALGGGFSDPAVASGDTVYLELPNITGSASPPNNSNVIPTDITIDDASGTTQTATFVARFDQTDTYARYWVKCTLPAGVAGPYSNAVVTFPDNPNTGDARVFTAIQIVVAP